MATRKRKSSASKAKSTSKKKTTRSRRKPASKKAAEPEPEPRAGGEEAPTRVVADFADKPWMERRGIIDTMSEEFLKLSKEFVKQ